jgi:hypothetical protein
MARAIPFTASPLEIPPLPEIYILWHPACAQGAPIAWQIRQWLRPAAGQGPQISYRSDPALGGSSPLPLPLPGEGRPMPAGIEPQEQCDTLQLVIPLLDHAYIYSRTQLAAFYDENNIPYGDSFAEVLEGSLQSGETAALIAVVSDAHASRPWKKGSWLNGTKLRAV